MILIVKGTREQAETELAVRRITGTCKGVYNPHEVQLEVSEDQRTRVIEWFCETGNMPESGFPAGTLLWHS